MKAEAVVNLLVLLFGFTMVAQPFVIPSSSMEGSLLVGDYVLVDKLCYSPSDSLSTHLLPYTPVKRGDVIVFRYPMDVSKTFVKRVVGIPGDRIHIREKQVWLNGKPLAEPYKKHLTGEIEPYRDTFPSYPVGPVTERGLEMLREQVKDGELIVPDGQYFAMGDNRDNSLDSRYWGFVPRENIIGRPVVVFFSFDAPQEELMDGNKRLAHLADIALHLFTKTRWSRLFTAI
jgi:signal peptidase I